MAPFGFPPRPSGILVLLSLSEAFLSALSFLSFDPKIDSLDDFVGVSAFAVVSTAPFSPSFKFLPPTPSFASFVPPSTASLGAVSSSTDLSESAAENKNRNV